MESNQDEANTFTCRCGKVFNGAQNVSRHCKRCKFVPSVSAVDEVENMTLGDVSKHISMSCASFLSIA
jgi:hypothetical protein